MSVTELVLASNNAHKVAEVQRILEATGAPVRVLPLSAFPEVPEPPEDQETFAANALQKARYVYERTGRPALADDSGLAVRALGGAPGVRSKRFTPEATAASNNARLLELLKDSSDRGARFVCALGLVGPGGERVVEGRVEGSIGYHPRGQGGFGYDPLFLPHESPGRTMAELAPAEKDAISHRGRALAQLGALLDAALEP